MYQSPEQKALEQKALNLFAEVNRQIDRIGQIIRQMRELITKGGEHAVHYPENNQGKVSQGQ